MEDAGALKRRIFHHFMDVARRCGADILDGKAGVGWRSLPVLAGQPAGVWAAEERARRGPASAWPTTAGRRSGPTCSASTARSASTSKQLYGQTETCAYVCLQPTARSAGFGRQAGPFVEVKIADNGEVLVRGRASQGLQAPPTRPPSRSTPTAASDRRRRLFDADGHLKIIDRAKDVGKLADGTMFAP